MYNDEPTPTPADTLARLTFGARVRWSEPSTARRGAYDTDPRSGEGVVVDIDRNPAGTVRGVTVAYHPELAPDFTAKAYYTTGFTCFEILAD
jgi:hypothetical protein